MKTRVFYILLLLSLIFLRGGNLKAQSMQEYCHIPPYLGQVISPNVMLLIDVSEPMGWCAYNPDSSKRVCCNSSSGCGWTFRDNEEGYFDPNKIYSYNSSRNYWEEARGTHQACPRRMSDINRSKLYKGSCLNFLYMRRIDLVRWALTGGTLNSCPTGVNVVNPTVEKIDECNPEWYGKPGDNTSCDSYGCILKSHSGEKVKVPWSRIYNALLFRFKTLSLKPRIGVMFFSGSGVRNKAGVYIGDFYGFEPLNLYRHVITRINMEDPLGNTPIAPALWDTYNYFSQKNPDYGGLPPQTGESDKNANPMYQCINDASVGCGRYALASCAKNFVVLITHGMWNHGGKPPVNTCSINTGFENYSADPVVPAYWLHKRGFTNQKTGIQSRVEAIYVISLSSGGTGEQTLKNVAMYGSFDLSHGDWPGNLGGYPQGTCNMDECGPGKGSGCTPLPPSSPDWDKDRDGIPDTFYSVNNAVEIKNAILSSVFGAFQDVSPSSGSTVATFKSKTGTASVFAQPYFYPGYARSSGSELSWIGFLRSFWMDAKQNLREDTITNKILNLTGATFDKIFMFFFDESQNETKVAILNQSDISTSCSRGLVKSFNEVIPVFDSACDLANTSAGDRKIYYNKSGTLQEFTTSQVSTLLPIFQAADSSLTSTQAQCIIRYVRGENLSGDSTCGPFANVQRTREFNSTDFSRVCPAYGGSGVRTWKLGDIVNSAPSVVGAEPINIYHLRYGDSTYLAYIRTDSYKNRTSFMLVGANDGMLHAFRVGFIKETEDDPNNPARLVNSFSDSANNLVGKEEWAFIPHNALPYLVWYGRPDYCRVPTVDYRTFVFDASIGGLASSPKDANSWRTVLIGTMGFGGKALGSYSSSIFALDLTKWLDGTQDKPTLLWEVRLPDGTLTTSFPAVIRLGDRNENGDWYVVIGTGPLDPGGTNFVSQPKLYFINLRDGSIVKTLNVAIPIDIVAAVGDIAVVDVDNDYKDDAIYFGMHGRNNKWFSEYLLGSDWYYYRLWASWGNFYRLSLRSGNVYKLITSLTSSDICNVVDLGKFEIPVGRVISPPVFGAPNFAKGENNKLWVFFGTGRYLSPYDRIIPHKNFLVGFKDDNWNGTCTTYEARDLSLTNPMVNPNYPPYLYYQHNYVREIRQLCMCDSSGCGMKNVVYEGYAVDYNYEPTRGWYYELKGEGIHSQPFVYGGIVDALTFVPSGDICQAGGSSNLISLNYRNGLANLRPSVLSPNATYGSISIGGDVALLPEITVGRGVSPLGNPFQALQSAFSTRGVEKFLQLSSGFAPKITQQRATEGERFILWIEK